MEVPVDDPDQRIACAHCKKVNYIHAFPALWTGGAAGSAGEQVLLDDESACYYHPEKRATVVCEGCGRFLCGLCDVDFKGKHLCTGCIEHGIGDAGDTFRSEYTRYDNIAMLVLGIPIVTVFLIYLTFFTAPIALYLCIRYWRAPLGPVHVNRWRFLVAGTLALLIILLVVIGIIAAVGSIFYHG